nr:MAG TPA: hypothetical protein [Caudoviricetes sp.]
MLNSCKFCSNAHNGINGCYCKLFNKYVEHMHSPICINKNNYYE